MIILFFRDGDLGNQLFQYAAMRRYDPEALIISVGLEELDSAFAPERLWNLSPHKHILRTAIFKYFTRFFDFLITKFRLARIIEEERHSDGLVFKTTNGFLQGLCYFRSGFYQSDISVANSPIEAIQIRPEIIHAAESFLDNLNVEPLDRFFVHIRRGDYTRWPSLDQPSSLPLGWYLRQMEEILCSHPTASFIIVTNDLPYALEFFSHRSRCFISRESGAVDLAIMSLCAGGGILSASSYSWWGAFLSKRRNSSAHFIAPLYWLGARTKEWAPSLIRTPWLSYARVILPEAYPE